MARVMATLYANPNIVAVLLLGDVRHGVQTNKKLEKLSHFGAEPQPISAADLDWFADRIAMPTSVIAAASKRLAGKLFRVATQEDLIARAHEALLSPPATVLSQVQVAPKPSRFIQRQLETASISLRIEDGCRVSTLALAYPLVLEVLRSTLSERTVRDQLGQSLAEVVDFKLVLTTPANELVPTFYDRESLEGYFQSQFIRTDGLFRQQFSAQGNDQWTAVLDHMTKVIVEQGSGTRRAVLVVPHRLEDGLVDPLGLVAVRLFPSYGKGGVSLNFTFIWRTVEALVGFPYSAYGSIRLAETIVAELRLKLDASANVNLGYVDYLACSLHMAVDDATMNIARRIIDAASI